MNGIEENQEKSNLFIIFWFPMHAFILIGCPFIAVDKSSFKEYIDVLGEWVTSDCPNGYLYSAKQCKCVLQGKKIK